MIQLEWGHIWAILCAVISAYGGLIIAQQRIVSRLKINELLVDTMQKKIEKHCQEDEAEHSKFYNHKDQLREEMHAGFKSLEEKINQINTTLAELLTRMDMRRKDDFTR